MEAIVGMGVGADQGFLGRSVTAADLLEEDGERALSEAAAFSERPDAAYGAMLEAIVRRVLGDES